MKKLLAAVTVLAVSTAQADTGPFQQPGVVPDTGPSGPGVILVGSVGDNGLTFYDNEADFLAALPVSKTHRGLETFEENDLPDDTAAFLRAPLCSGIANFNFPDGLTGLDNVCISSPDPALATIGFAGIASDAVGLGSMTVGFPTVITFNQPPLPPGPFKTAVSLNLYSINSGGDVTVTVLDPAGNVLGSATYLGAGTTPTFAGIIVGPVQAIASIEIDSSGGFELVDDISPWFGPNCLAVITDVVNCHADGSSFTYTVQGIDSCTGGISTYSFTASGGAVGEEMCFTVIVDDGGFCCTTEICVTIPDCTLEFQICDFDALPGGDVVTNQYPGATFSSSAGNDNKVHPFPVNDTPPNILCTGPVGGPVDCEAPTFIDFTNPVESLTFYAIGVNDVGPVADVNVFIGNVFDSTVPVIGAGTVDDNILIDLSRFTNVTRIELTNITDYRGIGWDTFSFSVAALPSDLDGDGIVGMVDFLALLEAWGSCSDCSNCPADFDGDCSVGILDLLILLGNWTV